jgi:hypothetical protein
MRTSCFANSLGVIILAVLLNAPGTGFLWAQESEDSPPDYSLQSESVKITLGVVEDVVLSPWGISFPARIDTGADISSLDARDIAVRDNFAEFKLGRRFGGRRLRMPVVEWRRIQTSTGTEKRPVVEISICLGSKRFRTLATLKDRSQMMYPFLVGRSALSGNFLIDPSRVKAAHPACPAGSLASSSQASPQVLQ